ncbi:kelch domain-containing [Pyrenophora seminiperda CCB06]|uniref:Kelch domain-containing n=1 Tax=Pyrenophora seminiperda CCB06 TaxID=1302712 RepID=A0A3M7LZ51_9PLEO|nr:kelch domain-containing [Pyrenophora seminiperda CCB06]
MFESKLGKWSDIIKFPIIPVAAYVVPDYPSPTKLMVYSAYSPTAFGGERGKTQFAEYNWVTGVTSTREVAETNHDMFCPGMSALGDGRLIITGGSNAEKTTIYDPKDNKFTSAPDMKVARGYQSSAILSNGKIFTIGGSWSGPRGGKPGEIYDPNANSWTLLPGAAVEPMLTQDHEGIFREDNHAWLFPWRNGTVFQAGPSKAMNWYYTDNEGGTSHAGVRDYFNDAMCGVHVMYDVSKIFSAGGSQWYDDSPALSVAHLIEIDNVGAPAKVENLPNMRHARAFANVIFTPPYLNTGSPRPVIDNLKFATVAPGGKLEVEMKGSADGVKFSLIRIGSVTHNVNSDQRRVPLNPKVDGNKVELPILNDQGVMLPGAWYLFAVSKEGVPSVAKTVYVSQV